MSNDTKSADLRAENADLPPLPTRQPTYDAHGAQTRCGYTAEQMHAYARAALAAAPAQQPAPQGWKAERVDEWSVRLTPPAGHAFRVCFADKTEGIDHYLWLLACDLAVAPAQQPEAVSNEGLIFELLTEADANKDRDYTERLLRRAAAALKR